MTETELEKPNETRTAVGIVELQCASVASLPVPHYPSSLVACMNACGRKVWVSHFARKELGENNFHAFCEVCRPAKTVTLPEVP